MSTNRNRGDLTPLMFAAAGNPKPEVIDGLQAGANRKQRSKEGKTAFDHAAGKDNLKRGADAREALKTAAGELAEKITSRARHASMLDSGQSGCIMSHSQRKVQGYPPLLFR